MDLDATARLIRELETFQPIDPTAAASAVEMLALLDDIGQRAFSRDHVEPGHFTASIFVVSPTITDVLVIEHAKLRRWLQPGGHIDASDATPLDAALRELREETGLTDVDTNGRLLDCDVHPIPANPAKNEPAHLHFDLRYEAVANTTELTPGDDALAAKWLDLRDAGRLRDKSVRRVATWLARQRPWAERRRT